jgi:magnesium chelatase family protein
LVTVEVHLSNGLPGLSIVGLPETAVKESKDRVRGALLNSRFQFPIRRITVNLAPADLPKEGGRFDLPIALGVLAASGQLPKHPLATYEFAGELALSGAVRPIRGVLPIAWAAGRAGRTLVVPADNAAEAALAGSAPVLGARTLLDVCAHLSGSYSLLPGEAPPEIPGPSEELDLVDVRGQRHAKRALEVAASGGHSLLLVGPPGTGKSMLAARLPSILPPMRDEEALEVAAIVSVSRQELQPHLWRRRPFRSPHHTASGVALVGGGSNPSPGEVSLAHQGVLFLDELPEFDRRVLEVLREPLETGRITISRASRQADFPARFQLIAAMNPCPCGYLGDPGGRCHCSADQVRRYRGRISGPLLDRIDMHIEVPRLPRRELWAEHGEESEEASVMVRQRVSEVRSRQLARGGRLNCELRGRQLRDLCRIGESAQLLLEQAMERLGLSARAYHRLLRIGRTIADMDGVAAIGDAHLSEAISYRRLDRRLG